MGYYELYNHSASSGGELYHHGVKGQKWGVRRQEKRAASRVKLRREVRRLLVE